MVGEKTGTDSQAIFLAISKFGIDAVVPLLQGAWALVWFDTNEGSLNFLRNKEREFWYAYEKGFKKVFWSSEHPILSASIRLSSIPYELFVTEENNQYFATAPDWLYHFDLDELIKGSEERPKPKVKELKGKEPAQVVSYTGGNTPFVDRTTVGGGTTSTTSYRSNPKVVSMLGSKGSPLAGVVTEERFNEIADFGCSFCQADVFYEDVGVTIFVDKEIVLCPVCSGNGDHSRIYKAA